MKNLFLLLFIMILPGRLSAQDTKGDIKARIDYEVERRNAANEKITEEEMKSKIFSAPATFRFYGSGGDGAIYYSWYLYKKGDMENPLARYTDKDMRYIFEESGEYVIRLVVEDKDSNASEDTFSFTVTESHLDVPNYFSPGDSPGSNDEFKVAYRSLVKFRCTIFNRWGQKLFEFTDPAKGWDGRYKGKYVNTGVYYYVIEALGSDGVRYKRGGDINILRSR
ncbi:MAG: gliding motility-associated C-terminal domain-containing protein [Prevotella sp.]|jgi:gliding motility-associated-like protein|nr:gliding motility-associated C-terminal domain-containing protein [Prevotella sp.]